MTEHELGPDEAREALVQAVTRAVGSLVEKKGIDPLIVFEASIKGASAALIATGTKPAEISELLTMFAQSFDELDQSEVQH